MIRCITIHHVKDAGQEADVVDPTALDSLFDPRYDGTPRTGGRLSFVYNNCGRRHDLV
ncbi:HalOD1 output domain-containing protein [Halomicroarcula sp. GCM10025324]|uniref:HalOD1 output domain-containing protein n=1 Tax=Haloarcula TaxID=2237 RepID=UPI0023E882FC|nr:HalOD1 output domain-containing protein [Halomicroarcula sp. ZS-22-S1]